MLYGVQRRFFCAVRLFYEMAVCREDVYEGVSIDMAGELEFTFVFSATTVTTIGGGESETVSYVLDGDCIYMEGGTVTSEIVELTNDTLKLKFVVDGEGYDL